MSGHEEHTPITSAAEKQHKKSSFKNYIVVCRMKTDQQECLLESVPGQILE